MAADRGEAGHNAVESLRRGGGSEHVRCVDVSGGLALEGQLEWLKEFFPGVPTLVTNWFAVPDGAVAGEGVAFELHERHESGEHFVGGWKLGSHRFFLGLFHVNNELGHTWVSLPQFAEAKDELHPRGPVQAGALLLEVVEDFSDQDACVKRPGDAQLLDPRQFEVGQDEVARTHLNCADLALVGRPGFPAVFHPAHFGKTVVLWKSFDGRVVIGPRVAHEIESSPVVRLVYGIGEDHAGGAAGSLPSEGDAMGAHDERLVELLQVGIARLCRDVTRTVTLPTDQRETEKRILILQAAVKKNGRWEASDPHTVTAFARVTAARTATTRRTATSTPQPRQVRLAHKKISTRDGTTGSCDRMGGRIT